MTATLMMMWGEKDRLPQTVGQTCGISAIKRINGWLLAVCCFTKRCQTPVSIFTIIIFVFDLDDQPKNHLRSRQQGDNNNNLNDCYFGNAVQSRLGWLLLLLLSSSHCETLKMTMPGMPINFTWKWRVLFSVEKDDYRLNSRQPVTCKVNPVECSPSDPIPLAATYDSFFVILYGNIMVVR